VEMSLSRSGVMVMICTYFIIIIVHFFLQQQSSTLVVDVFQYVKKKKNVTI
jgi:hypothetical protein